MELGLGVYLNLRMRSLALELKSRVTARAHGFLLQAGHLDLVQILNQTWVSNDGMNHLI